MVKFPELRALMAKHGVTQDKMAKVIEASPRTFVKKINNDADFTFSEMFAIKSYFINQGSKITIDQLFFDWKFTKVNDSQEA